MQKYTLVLNWEGTSESAAEDAFAEAVRLIESGCISGSDSNEDSRFDFDIEDVA